MDRAQTTVEMTGERPFATNTIANGASRMGTVAAQPAFIPIARRKILSAVNTCAKALGLRHSAIVVLDALVSFLPCRNPNGTDNLVTSSTLLTIYASNETLCFRAKGMSDRQLRRQIDILEQVGLLIRRDSANGKRYPVTIKGKIVGAYGLDISPLFSRSDAILRLAEDLKAQAEELRVLKTQIMILRARYIESACGSPALPYVESLRNIIRRQSLTIEEAQGILGELTDMLNNKADKPKPYAITEVLTGSEEAASSEIEATQFQEGVGSEHSEPLNREKNSSDLSAIDGQNVRHIKTRSKSILRKKDKNLEFVWRDLSEVNSFYPKPNNYDDSKRIAIEFGQMLCISKDAILTAVSKLGVWAVLKIEDTIAKKIEDIRSPEAYLRRLLTV